MTPCQECQKKVTKSEFRSQRKLSVHGVDNFILVSTAHERIPWLCSLVKHNVAAENWSSNPLTSNELGLLELRIKSPRILVSTPNVLWDMCQSSMAMAEQTSCFNPTIPTHIIYGAHYGQFIIAVIHGRAMVGGRREQGRAKAPLKISKKGQDEKMWGIFMHQSYQNELFCHLKLGNTGSGRVSIPILALKGFNFRGLRPWPPPRGSPPGPPPGALPPGPPRFLRPPLTIYPGAALAVIKQCRHSI